MESCQPGNRLMDTVGEAISPSRLDVCRYHNLEQAGCVQGSALDRLFFRSRQFLDFSPCQPRGKYEDNGELSIRGINLALFVSTCTMRQWPILTGLGTIHTQNGGQRAQTGVNSKGHPRPTNLSQTLVK